MTKSIRNDLAVCAVTIGFLFSIGTTIYAQAPVGTITGTVTDSSGAVIPNATITITDKSTGAARSLTANAGGLYSAPALPPGAYEVRVAMEGFQTVVREAQVIAGSTTTADLALTLGATREVVTVEAATAQINYESHNVAGVIARDSINDLPLNGRSSFQLASLEPGVTVVPGYTSNFNSMFTITILGGGGVAPRFTLDGGIINDENDGSTGVSLNFSQDLVQEFQLAAANFDASTGIGTAGAINIVTRSGSNDFHASAYYFYRDHNMAAYPALVRSNLTSPFFQRKNPGVWVSGPIMKNKLFFFVSYEHMSQTQVINDQNDLPSLQPLNGIFPSPLHYNWISARFDYHVSDKNNLFLRHTHDGNYDLGPFAYTGNPSAWVRNTNWSDQSIFGLTTSLTPNTVNELRGAYHFWQNQSPVAPASACQLPCVGAGLPGIVSMLGSGTFTYGAGNYANGPQEHQMRSYEVADTFNWQKGSHRIRFGVDFEELHSAYTPYDKCFPACVYLYSSETTQALGKAFPAGSFNLPSVINSTESLEALPVYNLPASGSSAGVGIGNGSWPGTYEHNVGGNNTRVHPWFADTWKVTQNLTVNFGLGYDVETGLFPYNMPLPSYLSPILLGQTGGVASGVGKGTQTNLNEVSPLFGFAWALGSSKKTVIRGGAGLYWDTIADWQQMVSEASVGPAGDGRVQISASAFTNIFPNMYYQTSTGVQPLPIGASLPLSQLSTISLGKFLQILAQETPAIQAQLNSYGVIKSGPYTVSGIQVAKQGVELFPSKYPFLHSYQTSIGIQRELPGNMVLTADFARRQGVHAQLGEQDLNRTGRSADGLPPIIPKCATTPDFNPNDECSNGSITFWDPEGRSVYDGLLAKVQKRFSHRYQFVVSYAYQKNLAMNAAQNLDNIGATYGPSLARQNLNIAGSIDLPYGFKLSLNSSIITATPASPIISGIDLNGAGNTLYPLTFTTKNLQYSCFNFSCGHSELAAAVANFNATLAGTKAMNGATVPALTLPQQYQLGAPIIDQDVRVTKEFSYKERYRLQVFGEFFNALNIGNLVYGNLTLNSGAFGHATARVGQGSTFSSGGPRAIQVGARFNF